MFSQFLAPFDQKRGANVEVEWENASGPSDYNPSKSQIRLRRAERLQNVLDMYPTSDSVLHADLSHQ